VLGLGVALGRTFLPEEDLAGAQPVAVVSDRFWERRFARDPGLLGQSLTLNGVSITIVGIAAPDFSGTSTFVPDLWLPLALHFRLTGGGGLSADRNADNYKVYGRLRTGVAQGLAEAEINSLATQLQLAFPGADRRPGNPADHFRLTQASLSGPTDFRATTKVILILGAVGSVLLIACANVASLLLARSAARQREIAIRLAIGASRGRLIRQLLTENAVMSVFAGAMGVIFSWWTLHYLMAEVAASFPSYVTMALRLAPDQRVLAYMLFLSLASTVAFALAPALEASKPNLSSALKDEGAAFGGTLRKSGLRDLMVGTQVAICLILLIAAGLLARSSQRAFAVDLGFDYRGIVFLDVSYPSTESPAKIATARTQLAQQLERLPEIQSLAVASMLPLKGNNLVVAVAPNGGALTDPGTPNSLVNLVTPSYFDTMGIPILRGRNFTAQDSRDGSNFDGSSVIVSESTARRFWPGEEALGKRIALGPCRGCRRLSVGEEYPHSASSLVIGVAKDVRRSLDRVDEGTESSSRLLYLPATRASSGWTVMRVRGDEGKAVTAIEREFRATNGGMEAVVWDSRTAFADQSAFVVSRVGAIGCAIIGVLGLLMTSVGIYGTVGFAVAQRTQEIGVRMALGAERRDVLKLVLSQTMRPVALGLAVGFLGASMVSRLMSGFLFGLSVLDPVTFLGVSGFLATVALIAGYIPARKATRVDPMIALRYE
jgi:putative ABC transport system permease protein